MSRDGSVGLLYMDGSLLFRKSKSGNRRIYAPTDKLYSTEEDYSYVVVSDE